jgi:hypothetical protein
MKNIKQVIILLVLLGFTIKGSLYAQEGIEKLIATLPKIDGYIPVYYPEGSEKNAIKLQSLLQTAVKYYEDKFGICIPVTLILFSPKETRKFGDLINESLPYNEFLPFVNPDNPNAICLPASQGSALDNLIQEVSKLSPALQKLKLSGAEISDRFIALVALHLFSNLYINALKINQPVRLHDKMIANAIADAYIKNMSIADAELWTLMKETYDNIYLNPGQSSLLEGMGIR